MTNISPVFLFISAAFCTLYKGHVYVHYCSLNSRKELHFIIKDPLILLLLLKKVSSARLEESDIHPISPKTPAPQYQPIDRKKGKINGKRVEDYSRDRAA